MAGKASKKQAQANVQALKQLHTVLGGVLSLVLLRLVFSSKKRWFWMVILHLPAAACTYMLEKNGRPRFDSSGHVVREGMDLAQKGLTEWMFDIVYLTLLADSGVVVFNTMKFWYVMLLVPVYIGYKLKGIAGPMLGGNNNARAPSESSTAPAAETKSKRQAKREKNGDKVRYKYK
ncbi:LADA_0C11650g1_1 [Lachancea dasiensis]|uniref:LADA_0C11650g1_1 n=1 Tax=Lachancea dasiensis TaxID=1072105 RepID=A0A1G4J1Y6_9SACH|nr:LADA_0C11650g1_1 [Lachancea dasiensis]